MTQRAVALIPDRRSLEMVDHPVPAVETSTDVLVRILEVGICGTDRELAAFKYGAPPRGSSYLIPGHEALGQVVATGQLVVPIVRHPCPHAHCPACRHGRQDFCHTGDFSESGIKERHGFLTGTIVTQDRYLVPVPDELRWCAVMVEPLTIAEKALAQVELLEGRLPREGRRRRALVLGAGAVGLLGAMALVLRGYETAVYSREPPGKPEPRLVEALGARYVPAEDCALPELPDALGPIDLVYEATGASKLAFDSILALGTNGVLVLTGIPGERPPESLDADEMMRRLVLRNQVVLGTVNAGREDYERAVRDMGELHARYPGVLAGMVTRRHPLEDCPALLRSESSGIKEVVEV